MNFFVAKVFLLILFLLSIGCQKRYWFRNKIDNEQSKKYSVKVTVKNNAPLFLTDKYIEVMRKASVKQLKKKGYFELPIDSPQFNFILTISVDSFNAGAKNFTKKNAVFSHSPQNNFYVFKNTVKAISFKCVMKNYKYQWTHWDADDDIYYFGEYRDIGRSEGMVKYLIKNAKPR